jgi:hypothetical protein
MSGHENFTQNVHVGLVGIMAWDKELAYYRQHKDSLHYHGCPRNAVPEELIEFFKNHGETENLSCICDVDCRNCIFNYLDNRGNILERANTPLCGKW